MDFFKSYSLKEGKNQEIYSALCEICPKTYQDIIIIEISF